MLTGGITGFSFLLHYTTGVSFGLTLLLINIPFYILSIFRMGWEFTTKTLVAVVTVSIITELLPLFFKVGYINIYFAAIGGGFLMGVGLLIFFRHKSSLGGFNILALFLQEKYGWSAGLVQMALDGVILIIGFSTFNWPMMLASIFGAVLLNSTLTANHKPGRYFSF